MAKKSYRRLYRASGEQYFYNDDGHLQPIIHSGGFVNVEVYDYGFAGSKPANYPLGWLVVLPDAINDAPFFQLFNQSYQDDTALYKNYGVVRKVMSTFVDTDWNATVYRCLVQTFGVLPMRCFDLSNPYSPGSFYIYCERNGTTALQFHFGWSPSPGTLARKIGQYSPVTRHGVVLTL